MSQIPPSSASEELRAQERALSDAAALVRYLVLANSGGAVAVLSFMGAAMKDGHVSTLAILPLSLFFLGIVTAGFQLATNLAANMMSAAKLYGIMATVSEPWNSLAAKKGDWQEHVMSASFVCFVAGGICGLVFLGLL